MNHVNKLNCNHTPRKLLYYFSPSFKFQKVQDISPKLSSYSVWLRRACQWSRIFGPSCSTLFPATGSHPFHFCNLLLNCMLSITGPTKNIIIPPTTDSEHCRMLYFMGVIDALLCSMYIFWCYIAPLSFAYCFSWLFALFPKKSVMSNFSL